MLLIQNVMRDQQLSISSSKNTPEVTWDVKENNFIFKGI